MIAHILENCPFAAGGEVLFFLSCSLTLRTPLPSRSIIRLHIYTQPQSNPSHETNQPQGGAETAPARTRADLEQFLQDHGVTPSLHRTEEIYASPDALQRVAKSLVFGVQGGDPVLAVISLHKKVRFFLRVLGVTIGAGSRETGWGRLRS